MKKCLIIILSIVCAVGLLACSKAPETANVSENTKDSEIAGFLEMATMNEATEGKQKKKSIRLENENAKSESDVNIDENVREEYRHLFAGGFNALEVDEKTKVNSFTTYEIGSITQQFMAAAIMQQVQKGKLQTSDTIDKFFPDYPYGDQITIEQLLHMSSGIPDFFNESNKFFVGRTAEQYDAFMNGQMTDEEMLRFLYKVPLNFEPGKKVSYSNTNYYLLALILEQITSEAYENYVQKNLFELCQLMNTTCLEVGNMTSMPQRNGEYMAVGKSCRGAGDMHSNLCDILIWNRALLSGKVVDDAWLKDLLDVSEGFSGGFMDMGDNTMGSVSTTFGYAAVNIIYQSGGDNLYLIFMSPEARNLMTFGEVDEMVRAYLGE